MRTLRLNQTTLWYVRNEGEIEVTDGDGFYTGESEISYSEPTAIKLSLYPSNGNIVNEMFGKTEQFDMYAVSTDVVLEKDDLLFLEEPTGDYESTYDYMISDIFKSLNSYKYGLKAGV